MDSTVIFPMFIGVTLDIKLKWQQYMIDNLRRRLSSSIFAAYAAKATGSVLLDMDAYSSLFQSHLTYGLVVWGGSPHAEDVVVLVLLVRLKETEKWPAPA